ncbi:MAG: V-type ATP synthase subunit A, partial [Tidjanibacter sp.]|nr:V-type ATP synthase subunit A [Tidjanibacter sp.]
HEMFWKSELVDFVILQQDAFDDIDANCPIDRQKYMFDFVMEMCRKQYDFADFEECSAFFKTLINLFKQLNYTEWKSEAFAKGEAEIRAFATTK